MLRTVEREAWSDWLPVCGSAVSLDEEDTREKWHAVKKAAGLAGISPHEHDPPLEVEGSNILNVFSGPEAVIPKPTGNGDSSMQLERSIVPAMGGEAADLDPKSVHEGDAPLGSDLVSVLNDVSKSAAALTVNISLRANSSAILEVRGRRRTAICRESGNGSWYPARLRTPLFVGPGLLCCGWPLAIPEYVRSNELGRIRR